MTVNNTDTFLVERSGTSYKVEAQNLMADLQDTDLMLVERSGTSYKATGADIKGSLGGSLPNFNIADCFDSFEYTGNGSTQSFNLGMDLAGNGAMIIIKPHSGNDAWMFTTETGNNVRGRITTNEGWRAVSNSLTFTSTGFTLGSQYQQNDNGSKFSAEVFMAKTGFFDIVSYSGNSGTQNVSHSLGATPRMMWIKNKSDHTTYRSWNWYTEETGPGTNMELSETLHAQNSTFYDRKMPTDTQFTVKGANVHINQSGNDYVAMLFGGSCDGDYPVRFGSYKGCNQQPYELPGLGDNQTPQFYLGKQTTGTNTQGGWCTSKGYGMPGSPNSSNQTKIWKFNSGTESGSNAFSHSNKIWTIKNNNDWMNNDNREYFYMIIADS